MNTEILNKVAVKYKKNDDKSFNVGDTVKVYNTIREGEKSRTQIFKGLVIAKKHSGLSATFTVRKISEGIGVEKIFPVQSPNVEKVEVVRHGEVRRAKLYYLRDRVGKAALKVNTRELLRQTGVEAMSEETAEAEVEAKAE